MSSPPLHKATAERCFICLRRSVSNRHQQLGHLVQSPFHNISIYVKMKLQSEKLNCAGVRAKKFSALRLCSECAVLVDKFNQLYVLLEETRLRLNHSMQRLVEVMKEADDDQDSQSSQANGEVCDTATENSRLRNDFVNQCVRKLEMASPRVLLERVRAKSLLEAITIKTEVDDEMHDYDSTPDEDQFQDDRSDDGSNLPDYSPNSPSFSEKGEPPDTVELGPINPSVKSEPSHSTRVSEDLDEPDYGVDSSTHPQTTRLEPKTATTSKSKRVKDAISPPACPNLASLGTSPNLKNLFKCPYCPKLFHRDYFDEHCFYLHREHFLLKYKVSSVNATQFKEIVNKLLFPELLEPGTRCTECGKSWKVPNKRSKMPAQLSRHWISKHSEILRAKLSAIQRDPSVLKRLEKKASSRSGTKVGGVSCDLCGKIVAHLRQHIRLSCIKSKTRPKTVQCEACGKWMQERSLRVHEDGGHCKGQRIGYRSPRLTTVTCKRCGEKLPLNEWNVHKAKCKDGSSSKEGKRAGSPEMEIVNEGPLPITLVPVKCQKCGKTYSNCYSRALHQKYSCARMGKARVKCKGCGKEMHPSGLSSHLRKNRCLGLKREEGSS